MNRCFLCGWAGLFGFAHVLHFCLWWNSVACFNYKLGILIAVIWHQKVDVFMQHGKFSVLFNWKIGLMSSESQINR